MEIRGIIVCLAIAIAACACEGGGGDEILVSSGTSEYRAFVNPELVAIMGYSGDAMEPFVSRDGTYLFFNNNGADKDIFYAAFVNPTSAQFQGPIASINTAAVEGTPTLDATGRFLFVTTANYSPPTAFDTIYSGTWTGSSVIGAAPVSGLARTTPGLLIFDVEVSADGAMLFFADGDFTSGNALPDAADIAIAAALGGPFARIPASSAILANVNTAQLEYAPALSADGLELFFTRLDPATMQARIYRTTRTSLTAAFDAPQLVSAITGFVEGPALSPDEKSLYYHREIPGTGRFELYRVTRP
jgi:hypothetical protein